MKKVFMLLTLKAKVASVLIKNLFLLTAIFYLYSPNIIASEQNFQVHGFLSQGLIDVNGSNFVNDDGALSAELTELGLNGSYQLNSKLRLTGQVVYLDGGNRYAKGLRIDYALLDWSVYDSNDWQVNAYLGRFKNNHWLYSSTRDIPFARPSIILPQSVYFDGFRDIAVGSDGIALKISHSDDYGDWDLNLGYGTSVISDEQAEIIMGKVPQGKIKQDHDAQASFYWQPAFSSWRFGLSLLDTRFNYQVNDDGDSFFDGDFFFGFYAMNALYEGELWEFSGEIYQVKFSNEGFYHPQYSDSKVGQGAYLQSRYKVSDKLTLLARYERFYLDKNDKQGKQLEESTGVPAYFGYHRDTTVGMSYDFSSDLSLRLEYHWLQGAGRLTPVVLPNPQINSSKNWQLWSAQLMYWF
jgi:hypothetical protein